MTCCNACRTKMEREAWTRCAFCRRGVSAENLYDGTEPRSMCFLSLSNPLCSQDRPKLTQPRVPCIALACCLGATDAISVSSGASAREQAERVPLDAPDAYVSACSAASREKHVGGRCGLAPRVRPSRLPQPRCQRSCGPPRCLRDAATRLGLFQRHRWRLRVREEPSVLLLDSSGAIGGVLELQDDDYFISTAAEGRAGCLQGRSNRFLSAWSAACCV